MTWTAYRVRLRLLTPLHIGAGQIGNVQRARPYVTGKSLWGALTARITRDTRPTGSADDYKRIGGQVNQELAFSYFFPTVEGEEEMTIWPWGNTWDEFAWRYLQTYAATALNYTSGAAEEGSLHEVEYIAPATRPGKGVCTKAVLLIGYVFERDGCGLPWREALPRLQIGAERTYGWGRVGLIAPDAVPQPTMGLFGPWNMQLNGERPVLSTSQTTCLFAHAVADNATGGPDKVRGSIEPLVGRETRRADAHGEALTDARVCWVPGSTVEQGTKVKIIENGLWTLA